MSISNMDPNSLGQQPPQQHQEQFIPLSFILDGAIQRTYHQLMIMTDMLQATSDKERKIKIVAFSCKTRLLFMRIYALVKFLKSAHINVTNILSFLDQQAFIFVDTADFLYHLAKVKLVNARLPPFSISASVDVLNSGSYNRLPSCIKGRILPTEKIDKTDLESTYTYLNRIIQCRLALSELPYQLKCFKIDKGVVEFVVKNEFEIKLTLFNDNFKNPWRLISINFLTKDEQESNRLVMHGLQKQYIQDIVQQRLNENKRPLLDIYKSLHFIAQSMQLEILFQQMTNLSRINGGRFYRLVEYTNWKKLTVKYWLDYSKNQFDFKFTIFIGDNSDFLQTTHYPFLNWRDHKSVDEILKTDELYIEKVVNSIIKYRSRKRLIELQTSLAKIEFSQSTLYDQKPAIKLQFFDSQLKKECIWISIDYYTGLFKCIIQNSALADDLTLKSSFEECLNSESKNLETVLQKIRISLLIKQLRLLAVNSGFKAYENLSVIHFTSGEIASEFSRLEKKRLFIELNRHDNYLILITLRTKEDLNTADEIDWYDNLDLLDSTTNIKPNIYLLHFDKCRFDGETDQTKPFLKLKTINRFNDIISSNDFKHYKPAQLPNNDRFKRSHLLINPLKKPKLVQEHLAYNRNIILSLLDKILYIEDALPLLTFTNTLNKQQMVAESHKKNLSELSMNSLSILSEPKLEQNMTRTSSELWELLISCNIRQKLFKDYFLSAYPVTYFYKYSAFVNAAKFVFSLEMNMTNNKIKFFNIIGSNETSNLNSAKDTSALSIFNISIDIKNLDNLYESILSEWYSVCQMYKLIKELNEALTKHPEMVKKLQINLINFQKLRISYGPLCQYTIQFEWLKSQKTFDILLDVNTTVIKFGLTNPHLLFINEIKRFFNTQCSLSVLSTIKLLNSTFTFAYALNRLVNTPGLNSKISITPAGVSFSSFMLVVLEVNHVRLVFHSKYWVDVRMDEKSGVITLRDSSFDTIDAKKESEQMSLLKFLSDFFKLFVTQTRDTDNCCVKSEYYFGIEEKPVSPRTLIEIDNFLDVLQTEFSTRVNPAAVIEEPPPTVTQSPMDEDIAFKSVRQEDTNFEENIIINDEMQNSIYQNGHSTESENKDQIMSYSIPSTGYNNYNYADVKSVNNIDMIDELPASNGNVLSSEVMNEKELLASIDVDNNVNSVNIVTSTGGQWDSLIDSVKPQQQFASSLGNNENIDFDSGSANMN